MSRRVLLLAWEFPPYVSGGVYRVAALVKYGNQLGWDVQVLARIVDFAPTAAGRYLLQDLPPEKIHRVGEPADVRYLPSGLLRSLYTFVKAQALFRRDPPDIVMASGPPFHNFAAALALARRFRARLVLDYRDEWTESPFDFIRKGRVNRLLESRCLARADGVILTTDSIREQYLAAFPGLAAAKCVVIPNGWEPADFETGAAAAAGQTLSFWGTLGEWTLPGPFLATLQAAAGEREGLRRLRLRFIGAQSAEALAEIGQFAYPEMVQTLGPLPKDQANRLMRQEAALLLINGRGLQRYLPGKLFDYLASGAPILVYGAGGEVGRLVSRLQAGIVVPEGDAAALGDALETLLTADRAIWNGEPRRSWLRAHTREMQARRMLALFETLPRG